MRELGYAVVGVVVGVMSSLGGAATPVPGDPVKLSPQYYTVKLENDRVRVLEYRLKPGQKEVMHTHPPYVVYVISEAAVRITMSDGKVSDTSLTQGEAVWRDALSHQVENVGRKELHALLVELKPATP